MLLDEPSEGLAPRSSNKMADTIRAMKGEGLVILVASKTSASPRGSPTTPPSSKKGRLRFAGSFAELQARPDLRDDYLAI